MKNLLLLIFCFLSLLSFSQRGVRTGQSATSITSTTCYNNTGALTIQISVGDPSGTPVIVGYTLNVLKNGSPYAVFTSTTYTTSSTASISLSSLAPGIYAVSGSISAVNTTTSTSYGTLSLTSSNYFVGTAVVWDQYHDMTVQPNPATILETASSWGGAISLNEFLNGFFIVNAKFGTGSTAARSVYLSLSNQNTFQTFNPTSESNYFEFRYGGTTPGIYLKCSSGTFKMGGVIYSDRISVMQSAGLLYVYNTTSGAWLTGTNVSTSALATSFPYTGICHQTVFTSVSQDGVENVLSSERCNTSSTIYAELKPDLNGYYHVMKEGAIRFRYHHDYDQNNNLNFNIYKNGRRVKSQADFPALVAINGDNYLEIDVNTTATCIGKGDFVLEVINDKYEKSYLRFYNDYFGCESDEDDPNGDNPTQ